MDGWERDEKKETGPFRDPRINKDGDFLMSTCLEKYLLISHYTVQHKHIHTYTEQRN